MKNKKLIIITLLLLIGGALFTKHQYPLTNDVSLENKSYYTCSMHTQIREGKPGRCPVCGMNLTHVESENSTHNHHDNIVDKEPDHQDHDMMNMMKSDNVNTPNYSSLKLTTKQVENFNSSTYVVQKRKINKTLRLLGKIIQSEKKQSNIPARIRGRVEKVYINSTGSFISKNNPVVDIYSPALITAGEEYLISYKNNQKDLLSQAKKKLMLWGIRDFQLNSWLKNNKIPRNITIYSDASGVVTKKNAVEGKYFKEGESFYDLVNLSTVWVEMDVYEYDSGLIKIGQQANIEFIALPGEKWQSDINFISPVLDENTRTLKIRTTLSNKNSKLKPGMVGEVHIISSSDDSILAIPNSSIIDTGERKIIWIEKDINNYLAKEINTGLEGAQFTEVKSGLNEGDKVVVDGNFLLDAQSQLSGNNMVHNH